jgi:hypothetical protein
MKIKDFIKEALKPPTLKELLLEKIELEEDFLQEWKSEVSKPPKGWSKAKQVSFIEGMKFAHMIISNPKEYY